MNKYGKYSIITFVISVFPKLAILINTPIFNNQPLPKCTLTINYGQPPPIPINGTTNGVSESIIPTDGWP